jgi:hypothetical protein
VTHSGDNLYLSSDPTEPKAFGTPYRPVTRRYRHLVSTHQHVSGWLGIALLVLLLVVACRMHRVGQRTAEGDLNQIEKHPSWFPGVMDRLDLLRWTIVVSAILLTAAMLIAVVVRRKIAIRPATPPASASPIARQAFKRASRPAVLAGCGVASVAFGLVLLTRRFVVDGQTVWALGDDAMISMRFAYQFAHGNGLVWNLGEHIEGFTNPGWTMVMAAVHALLPGKIMPPLVILLLSAILLGVTAWATAMLLAEILGVPARLAAFGAALISLSPPLLFWTVQGFEVAPMSATLAVAVLYGARDIQNRRLRPSTVVLFAIVTVWRADAVAAAALFGGSIAVFSGQDRRSAATGLAWMAAGVTAAAAAQLGLRLMYYGALVPNTAVLKTTMFPHQHEVGLAYVLLVLVAFLPLVVGLVLLLRRPISRIEATLLLPVAGMLLVVVLEGGDVFPFARALAFCFPFVFAVVWARLAHMSTTRTRPVRTALVVSGLVLLTSAVSEMGQYLTGDPVVEQRNISTGLHMGDVLPTESKIALFIAGSPAYFNDLAGVDLLGKMDPVIARSPAKGLLPGHNKWDFAYSLGALKPDYIMIMSLNSIVRPTAVELAQHERGSYPFEADLWRDNNFSSRCAPHPVTGFDGLYQCKWPD